MSNYAVYRAYSAEGELLYVGVSANPANRLGNHKVHADWWLAATRVELDHLPAGTTRVAAEEAERLAIIVGRPLHNVRHNRHTPAALPQRLSPLDVVDDHAEGTLQEAADLFGVSRQSLSTRVRVHRLIPSRRDVDGRIRVRLGDVQRLALIEGGDHAPAA